MNEDELPAMNPTVQRLFDVLRDRKGFGWWWDGIDADIQAEIIEEMNAAVGE